MRRNAAGSNVTFDEWALWTRWWAHPNALMVVSFEWQSENVCSILRALKHPSKVSSSSFVNAAHPDRVNSHDTIYE